jgi:DNA-binding XRE family transcriptional regulator
MSDDLTPEQVKAARALLAWTQQELAGKAKLATSTVADFERGSRTPVSNNAQAMRDVLEKQGLKFIFGGVIAGTLPAPPPASRAGKLMRWIEATHLAQWGATRQAQGSLPEVVSRLIYATVGPAAELRFPSDDSVQHGGWDGICRILTGDNKFIPDGTSVWEFTTQKDKLKAKADGDYEKRKIDPLGLEPKDTTYVFLTNQRFARKEVWEKAKRAEGFWKDVRVIDADLLVHWLELRPGVAQWLAEKMNRRPRGLRSVREVWDEWRLAANPPLTAELILTDRDLESTTILKWLMGREAMHPITAQSADEAIAFLHATIRRLPDAYELAYESRCVVASDLDVARDLVGLGTPLIACVIDAPAGLVQRLIESGHYVYAIRTESSGDNDPARLPRPWRFNLRLALEAAGYTEEEAHRLSRASGRSLTVLRRIVEGGKAPSWATPSRALNAAVLAGGWNDRSELDRVIVSELAGMTYEQVELDLAPILALEGGPLRKIGSVWRLGSLRDAWPVVAPSIPKAQIIKFEDVFHRVLTTPNPRFDMGERDSWVEKEGEFGAEASPFLRHGLAQTMIALGVFPDRAKALDDANSHAERSVRKLFSNANEKLWWSLRGEFQELAEASPEAFLSAVEDGLSGPTPAIRVLFRSDEGMLHPQEYLSDLLWALEMLARSPKYLPRAALLLAQLDDMDPGGKIANRPAASLRRIFLAWTPQTYATAVQRLEVIDKIVVAYSEVGWKLLNSLSPRNHDTSEPSPHTDWRDFAPDEREDVTWASIARAATEIGNRLLAQVGSSAIRWDTVLDHWGNFPPAWQEQAGRQFVKFAKGLSDKGDVELIREAVRDLVQKHRNFSTADWAMPEAELKVFDEVLEILAPNTPQERSKWLFVGSSHFLRPNVPFDQMERERSKLQADAAKELLSLPNEEVLDFAHVVKFTHALGAAVANADVDEGRKGALLKASLQDARSSSAELATGYLITEASRQGVGWLAEVWARAIVQSWGEGAELVISLAMPVTPDTWQRVEARSAALEDRYWGAVAVFPIPFNVDLDQLVTRLIDRGRVVELMPWLHNHLNDKPPVEIVLRVLHAVAKADRSGSDHTMFGYYLGHLLDYLEKSGEVSESNLVQLEWVFFQTLRYSERPATTMERALAAHPEFFVQLIKLVYSPKEGSGIEEPEPADWEQAKRAATQAWNILHDWSRVPGSDEGGVIDAAALEAWVNAVRKDLKDSGREDIGDYRIGEVLAAAKAIEGEPWPPAAVRAIVDTVRSKRMEEGIFLGLVNRRGVTVRMPNDGGQQERDLAAQYRGYADALRFSSNRTALILDQIVEYYEEHARREDDGAELRDIE